MKESPTKDENREDMFVMSIAEPVVEKAEALYYFEEFCIQPMRLNLSFVRTERMDEQESRLVLLLSQFYQYIFTKVS